MTKNIIFPLIIALGFIFLYGPLMGMAVFSFNESRLASVWTKFSFIWYQELLNDHIIISSLLLSLGISSVVAILSVILGTIAAWSLYKYKKFRGRFIFTNLIMLPLILPDIIIALATMILFRTTDMYFHWFENKEILWIICAHTTLCMTFVFTLVYVRLSLLKKNLEEASYDLGATPFYTFCTIILPLLTPALLSGFLLAFVLSFDDIIIASMLAGPNQTTLPISIYSSIKTGLKPKINALSTLLLTGVIAFGLLIYLLQSKTKKNKKIF